MAALTGDSHLVTREQKDRQFITTALEGKGIQVVAQSQPFGSHKISALVPSPDSREAVISQEVVSWIVDVCAKLSTKEVQLTECGVPTSLGDMRNYSWSFLPVVTDPALLANEPLVDPRITGSNSPESDEQKGPNADDRTRSYYHSGVYADLLSDCRSGTCRVLPCDIPEYPRAA